MHWDLVTAKGVPKTNDPGNSLRIVKMHRDHVEGATPVRFVHGRQAVRGTDEMSNPNYVPGDLPPHPNRGSNRTVLIVIGVVAALVLVIVGSYIGTRIAQDDGSPGTASDVFGAPLSAVPDVVTEPEQDYSRIDPSTYNHDLFVSLPLGVQIDKCAPIIEERLDDPQTLTDYNAENKAINGYDMIGGIGTGDITDSSQEIANRSNIKSFIVRSEKNRTLALNLISCIAIPGTAPHSFEGNQVGNGVTPVPSTSVGGDKTDVFYQGEFAGIEAGGRPTLLARVGESVSGNVNIVVFQEIQGYLDSKITEVVIAGTVSPDDRRFITGDLTTWRPT